MRNKIRDKLNIKEEDFVIGFVGKFETIKGIDLFLISLPGRGYYSTTTTTTTTTTTVVVVVVVAVVVEGGGGGGCCCCCCCCCLFNRDRHKIV